MKDSYQVYITMELTVSYLLKLQNYINLNQKSEIKDYTLYLGNISKDFTTNNMKKKTGLVGVVNFFSVDFNTIDINNILYIHKYVTKTT